MVVLNGGRASRLDGACKASVVVGGATLEARIAAATDGTSERTMVGRPHPNLVAHNVTRPAVPVTTFSLGMAVAAQPDQYRALRAAISSKAKAWRRDA